MPSVVTQLVFVNIQRHIEFISNQGLEEVWSGRFRQAWGIEGNQSQRILQIA